MLLVGLRRHPVDAGGPVFAGPSIRLVQPVVIQVMVQRDECPVADVAGPVLLSVAVSWTRTQVAEYLACFLPTALPSGVSFPPLGPPGWSVPSSRVLCDTTTSPYPYPATYGFVARLQPQPSSSLGQVRGRFLPPGSFVSGPAPWDRWSRLGIRGPHRFLGCPFGAFALLFDPGRTSAPHRLGASVLPPYPIRRRLPRVNNFGAQSHGFGTRCLRFTAGHRCRTTARLACGWW